MSDIIDIGRVDFAYRDALVLKEVSCASKPARRSPDRPEWRREDDVIRLLLRSARTGRAARFASPASRHRADDAAARRHSSRRTTCPQNPALQSLTMGSPGRTASARFAPGLARRTSCAAIVGRSRRFCARGDDRSTAGLAESDLIRRLSEAGHQPTRPSSPAPCGAAGKVLLLDDHHRHRPSRVSSSFWNRSPR
jgi:hypothetical protein